MIDQPIMPDPEQPHEEPAEAMSSDPNQPAHPSRHFEYLLEQFRASLAAEGPAAYQRWGLTLYHSMNDEELEAQREQLGFAPADALDHFNRGCLLAAREDFAGAARHFGEAVKLDAGLAEALYNLALAQESAGQKAEAKRSWNQYLERFSDREDGAEVREHLVALA